MSKKLSPDGFHRHPHLLRLQRRHGADFRLDPFERSAGVRHQKPPHLPRRVGQT